MQLLPPLPVLQQFPSPHRCVMFHFIFISIMKKFIDKLPSSAVFDYEDVFGSRIYHSTRRRYKVHVYPNYTLVLSEPRD